MLPVARRSGPGPSGFLPRCAWLAAFATYGFAALPAVAQQDTDGLSVRRSPVTGLATFVTAQDPDQARQGGVQPIPLTPAAVGARPQPLDFFAQRGRLFGLTDVATQLQQAKTFTDRLGHTHTTFQQVHRGVPVFSGILRVHEDARGILAVNGDFYPVSPKLGVTPTLTADAADGLALQTLRGGQPTVEHHELVVVDPGWYGDPPMGAHLAYYVIVGDSGAGLREAFFVDALNGDLLDHWSLLHTAMDRAIHNGGGASGVPGPPARLEGEPPTGLAEVDAAYDYLGDTYGYYDRAFGRDSWDDAGDTIVATVNSTGLNCPNAAYSAGLGQMIFCAGVVTDDIVAHEYTHAVTRFTANLIYQNQSGQLNESYSDVFGEMVDLFNGDAAFAGPPGGPPSWPTHPTGSGLDAPNDLRGDCESSGELEVLSPGSIAGTYAARAAGFGAALTTLGITGDIVLAEPAGACDADLPFSNAAELAGKIVLVDRGVCPFTEKVSNVQDAGGIAAIVVNNVAFGLPGMSGTEGSITIGSVGISQPDGDLLKATLQIGSVTVTLRENAAPLVRWLVGEDSTAFNGAIRDMWNPTCFNHPDDANSPLETCNPMDSGGVHSGSGVVNHAFALVTDGKTFNGYTVTGIGPIKSGAIWYRALSVYLTPASDFEDAYFALNQAALDLMGTFPNDPRTGAPSASMITAADAVELDEALLAVEMNTEGACGASLSVLTSAPPTECDPLNVLYADDFESGNTGWTVSNSNPPTPYDWVLTGSPLPFARPGVAWFCDDPSIGDCGGNNQSGLHSLFSPVLAMPNPLLFPTLAFSHYLAAEGGFDGGNVKISVNSGAWQFVPRSAIQYNPYNSLLRTAAQGSTTPIAGQSAWTGSGGQWGRTVIDLSGLVPAGATLQLRFDFGKDGCTGIDGWYLDDLVVASCPDCNTNQVTDNREFVFSASSNPLGNIGTGSPQSFSITTPPAADSDVEVTFTARADLSAGNEFLNVDLNGTPLGSVFVTGALDCPTTPNLAEMVVPSATYNAAVGGGNAVFTLTATADVNPAPAGGGCGGTTWVALYVQYPADGQDCNGNDVPDDCDIAQGTSTDTNGNLIPDECQSCVESSDCADGNACTVDSCSGGTCSYQSVDCSSMNDACHVGVCTPGTGSCVAQAANQGQACDDGALCTTGETCDDGACVNGIPVDCSAFTSPCAVGVCLPANGQCQAQALVDGLPCSDDDVCTQDDACAGGACSAVAVAYGDVNRDGFTNADDALCLTDHFGGLPNSVPCEDPLGQVVGFESKDIAPCPTPGDPGNMGDGFVNLNDVLAILDRFAGITPPDCSCNEP